MNKPIKILRVVTRMNVGGPALHVTALTAGLNGGIFTSRLVAGRVDNGEGDMSFLAGEHALSLIQIDEMSNGAGLIGDLRSFGRLYRIIREEKPGIVHLHLLKARFLGGVAAKLARVPLVVETFHGNLFSGYYGRLKTAAILTVERFLGWVIMDRVVAISEGQKEELLRYKISSPKKIKVIPLGLDLSRFLKDPPLKERLKEELGLAENTLLIGTVGRLVPIKGLSYLLDAVALLAKTTDRDFLLLIVGDGPLRQELQEKARRLGIEQNVRFLGWRFDLEKIYADLDIVILSSLNEGTPVSLIEAMAAAKAVVATSVGGVPDVVQDGETGLLVPSRDPAALASALLRLLKEGNLRKLLGEQARTFVVSKYDKSRLLKDMEEFYLRLVAPKG